MPRRPAALRAAVGSAVHGRGTARAARAACAVATVALQAIQQFVVPKSSCAHVLRYVWRRTRASWGWLIVNTAPMVPEGAATPAAAASGAAAVAVADAYPNTRFGANADESAAALVEVHRVGARAYHEAHEACARIVHFVGDHCRCARTDRSVEREARCGPQ